MNDVSDSQTVAETPFYLSRADGMSDEYIDAATKLVTMTYQSLSGFQLGVLDAPAAKPWADEENRTIAREIANLTNIAAEIAENILPDLGVDPEPLRLEAEADLDAGWKLNMTTVPIDSWSDGVVYRMIYGNVLAGQLSAVIGSNYVPYANIAQKIYFDFCLNRWPDQVGSPHVGRVRRTLDEEGREIVWKSIEKWWPYALESFGVPGSKNEQLYLRLGLKTRSNAMCRDLFLRIMHDQLDAVGLPMPN